MLRRRLTTAAYKRLPWLLGVMFWLRYTVSKSFRHQFAGEIPAYRDLKTRVGSRFEPPCPTPGDRNALVFAYGKVGSCEFEKLIATSFEQAGYRPIFVAPRFWYAHKAYRLLGIRDLVCVGDYADDVDPDDAHRLLDGLHGALELVELEIDGIRVGKYVVSTSMRRLRQGGNLDLDDRHIRTVVLEQLVISLNAINIAKRMLDAFSPEVVLMQDIGYSPFGEFFDLCLSRNIPVAVVNASHRSGQIMVKRYGPHNADRHFASLSGRSWADLLALEWTAEREGAVKTEVFDTYRSGDWYSEVGTQINTALVKKEALSERLGLDPAKKTVALFPHLFWDATFFWGADLFADYEEWFREVLKVAKQKTNLNWVIKVHPANIVKNYRDNVFGEHSEIIAVRETLGELPDHMKLVPAGTDISTFSIFTIADYCLTVRGTVGIEAAYSGVRTLTAGTGRYDRLGFTIDSDDRDEYLERLRHIETIPPMSAPEIERALRFAYGIFIIRPTTLTSTDFEYAKDARATLGTSIKVHDIAQLRDAPDVAALAAWLASDDDDFCDWARDRAIVDRVRQTAVPDGTDPIKEHQSR